MVLRSGNLGAVGGGALLLLFGLFAFGEATVAMQSGASADDPGLLTMSSGRTSSARRRSGTAMSYGTQQLVGAVGAGAGLLSVVGGLALPLLLGRED